MADYHATARSNYFKVKDKNLFLQECSFPGVEVHFVERDGELHCVLFFENGIPYEYYPEIAEDLKDGNELDQEDIDWAALFAKHLQKDSVAIFMEIGAEKMRYLVGTAIAYNSKGEVLTLGINEIHSRIEREWGRRFTATEIFN
jgi:hypothetical protein